MGKAARWLRGLLLGGKKPAAAAGGDTYKPTKEKRGWGFARSFRDIDQHHRRGFAGDDTSLARDEVRKGASYREGGGGKGILRLLRGILRGGRRGRAEQAGNRGGGRDGGGRRGRRGSGTGGRRGGEAHQQREVPGPVGASGRRREEWAAVRIQAAFRAYLARRALSALRGLVKLQALVRGYIVRKQAAETLRGMQALVRVQARARACRALSENRRRGDGSTQTSLGPLTPQKFEPLIRASCGKHDMASGNLKVGSHDDVHYSASTQWGGHVDFIDPDRVQSWEWLDRWMEERYWDSREASRRTGGAGDDDKIDKILEIDPGKPHSGYTRRSNHRSSSTLASDVNSRSFATLQDSPSKDSPFVRLSIPSPSSVDMQQQPLSPLRFMPEAGEAYERPQVYSESSQPGGARRGPFTPAKSESSGSFYGGYSDYPNYMANTESSRAKLRSQSAPKQRPDYERLSALRVQAVGAGCGYSSPSSQKSASTLHLKFTSKDYPGSGRLDRMGTPSADVR